MVLSSRSRRWSRSWLLAPAPGARSVAVSCLLATSACAPLAAGSGTRSRGPAAADVAITMRWMATLAPSDGKPSLLGGGVALTLDEQTRQTRALISVRNATPGAQHPWRVATGRCGETGQMLGSAVAYPVLAVGVDGNAETAALLPFGLPAAGSYHVDVLLSRVQPDVIACGELRIG